MWCNEHKIRLTASRFGQICKMRSNTSYKNIVHNILYASDTLQTKSVQYDREMETKARQKYEQLSKEKVYEIGLIIDPEYLFLAASPNSIPDLSKVDQMAIVLRYCTTHNVQERLLELKPVDSHRVETHNVIIDSFCSQLEKRIEAYNFLKNNFLFITKLHVVSPQDTDDEEEVNKSFENYILLYKKDVDNTIQNEIIHSKNIGLLVNLHIMMTHKIICWIFGSISMKNIYYFLFLICILQLKHIYPYLLQIVRLKEHSLN
ncbi:hypothetical protein QTP88_008223 [Uroleucon formosanum]